ncbi:MAG TPA: hypothetical protein VL403_19735, partial [Candidatus Kryptonia bacterium]|nr:hypothetical protein [Candidatus Kryptonia bacterium]
EVRERIRTVAAQSPRALGLSRDRWSLELLRQYLMRSCVVVSISKEWLRQIVRAPRDDSDVQRVFEQFAEYAKTARPDGLVVN